MKSKIEILKKLQWLLIITLLTTVACKKEDELKVSEEFFNDGNHIFSFECRGDNLEFLIEALADTTNAVGGVYPNLDFYGIYVDYNRNGIVDPEIDLTIGPTEIDQICVALLTSPTSTKPCKFYDNVYGEEAFSSTENSDKEHVWFKVTVPKHLLSDSNKAHLMIRVNDSEKGRQNFPSSSPLDPERGGTNPPSNSPLFSEYFEIQW